MTPEPFATLDRLLLAAARGVHLLGSMTPHGLAAERARIAAAFAGGHPTSPRWSYASDVVDPSVRRALDLAATRLDEVPADAPLLDLYRARHTELGREVELVDRRGTLAFGALAEARFVSTPEADALASELLRSSLEPDAPPTCTSDGRDPTSLESRIRALVGALRIPFRVEVRRDLVPLAATGDGVILVAEGRPISEEAAARTALHEVHGHALPRARAALLSARLFAIGTARGVDEQEGYALVLEDRAGFLRGARARELAARHEAAIVMRRGADFVECVHHLERDHGVDLAIAIRTAERAYRGGDGTNAGLGRECVYLASFLRVRDHLAGKPEDETVLSSGQVSVSAAPALRPFTRG